MKCHPNAKIHVQSSCYTPQILEQIRLGYNEKHASNPISPQDNPSKLWKILNEKIVHCPAEDCWLNELNDEKLRKRIDRYIFAPDQPYEWKRNPNEWLSNFDILNVLEQYEETYGNFDFIGPTPIDFDSKHTNSAQKCVWNELCAFSLKEKLQKGKKKIGVIFNTDPHTKSGAHWISMFVDVPNRLIYFFDSAGDAPPPEVDILVKRIMEQGEKMNIHFKYKYNSPHQHQKSTTECGMYSLFFMITMLTGKKEKVPLSLKQRIRLFSKGRITDKFVEKYRSEYFNVNSE